MKWYLKQLLPFMYVSKYREDGRQYVSVWKMWLGRCYRHRKFEIVKEVSPQG